MWRLVVFIQGVLGLGIAVMSLVSGLMLVRHKGASVELAQSAGLLVLLLGLLLLTERRITGRWFRWQRR
ncbi:hypothetical protein [Streptomyces sp. NPDC059783]|uniref:hypothetical protein n=1 Tax=Streptomyces sp. NPDC059783 TaxID=3346944 RepID=UPI003664B544